MLNFLLAFDFASPWMLWGLSAAALPLLIHLLSKRKYRETQWAAMKFLLEAVRKQSRRIRIEQLILLAVRTAILLLVALALARPIAETLGSYFPADEPAHRIIVIDSTLSMALQPDETTLFDRAKDVARQIVEKSRQGEAVNVVRVSDVPPTVIVQTPSYQSAEVIAEIDQLTLPHARGHVLPALKQVEELLHAAPDLPRKEVFLISDFQRATWSQTSAADAAELRQLLKQLDDRSRLVLMDVGQAGAENVAITDFSAFDSFVTIGRPARFKVVLRNFASQRAVGKQIEFFVDGKLTDQRTLDIAAGGEVSEVFSHVFAFGGEHRLQARLGLDALPLDNQRWLAVPVQEQIKALCINGKTTNRVLGKATDYLELALAPASTGDPQRSLIQPQVINEGELPGLDLSKYDCVFLCNVGLFTEREAKRLETYLKQGGGVIWCLGDQVQADNYNQLLYRQGAGILPARLGDRRIVAEANRQQEAFEFNPGDFSHPIINPFQGNPDAGLQTTKMFGYVKVVLEDKSTSRVALSFDTGDPVIVEKSVGLGKSILVTTSVDDQWGNWALWPSFLPLVQEMALYAVSGRWSERQHFVGESLSCIDGAVASEGEATVIRPDGQSHPLTTTTSEAGARFNYDGTDVSGIYEFTVSRPVPETELFAVNIDSHESDLTKLEQDELSGELFAGLEIDYRTQLSEGTAEVISPVSERGRLTRGLLYVALALIFVEQMMAWNFVWGAWMLYCVLSAAILQRIFLWSVGFGFCALVILLIPVPFFVWRRNWVAR